ncbi:helix-turn-helix domain-containing protein [Haloflavibacter putidus]|uniref:Helix-turn-helix domain-containing protein n=2 Tax=Flavobacteriaceae TaxID=49546 RepID=A0A507ZLF2_9FLAO|nr:helix-turn-helix domain-containing protein [Haloflavibacter putidus]TQD38516.1 helix-turn-helix domain-containing protein [Haloflavibacter putidus]
MSQKIMTEIHGISPEELKESILTDVKKELVNLVEKLNLFNKPQEEFLTRKEAAKLLKISLVTITDWNKKGILNPYRLGNLIRYKKSELEEAMVQINQE